MYASRCQPISWHPDVFKVIFQECLYTLDKINGRAMQVLSALCRIITVNKNENENRVYKKNGLKLKSIISAKKI